MHFFGCLGWLCNIALAQFEISESVTGSANFPAIGIAFLGNLAVFITSLLRGRLDLEMGARDVLATLRGPQLYPINDGFGLTTCEQRQQDRFAKASVVMLSYDPPNSSMKQFMRYICNAYKVHSILLQCFPLKSKSDELLPGTKSDKLLPGICNCIHDGPEESKCNCIVFWNVEEIVKMLAPRMPGTLKRLSDSLCLLPSPQCLKTGCHGCIQAQLPVEETDESGSKILTEDDIKKGKKAVKEIFEYISGGAMKGAHPCICIPLSPSGYDYWTKLLTRSFGATAEANRDYSTASLLLPRLTEVLLQLSCGWLLQLSCGKKGN
jgi:hypothetical protein